MTLLEVEGLTKRFGGLVAVNGVSFTLGAGEITGILGPNGAGKTTVFNLLTGFLAADAGDMRLAGASLRGLKPHTIVRRGMARTFQLARPFRLMSVLDNVAVACLAPHVRRTTPDVMARARQTLAQVGLDAKAHLPVEILPYGDLRRLEIARALATSPRVLLLDEPFAGLGASEIQPLADLIRKLHSEGISILLIEHKLREMMRLVERVIALDFGEVIAEGRPEEIVRHPKVIEAYLGRDGNGDGTAGDR